MPRKARMIVGAESAVPLWDATGMGNGEDQKS